MIWELQLSDEDRDQLVEILEALYDEATFTEPQDSLEIALTVLRGDRPFEITRREKEIILESLDIWVRSHDVVGLRREIREQLREQQPKRLMESELVTEVPRDP